MSINRIIGVSLVLVTVILIPVLFAWVKIMTTNEMISYFECTGTIGDTIGGLTSPILSLVGTFFLAWTIWLQIDFNSKQQILYNSDRYFNVHNENFKGLKYKFENFEYTHINSNVSDFYTSEGVTYKGNYAFFILATIQVDELSPIQKNYFNVTMHQIQYLIIQLDQYLINISLKKDLFWDNYKILSEEVITFYRSDLGLFFTRIFEHQPNCAPAPNYHYMNTKIDLLEKELNNLN